MNNTLKSEIIIDDSGIIEFINLFRVRDGDLREKIEKLLNTLQIKLIRYLELILIHCVGNPVKFMKTYQQAAMIDRNNSFIFDKELIENLPFVK